MRIKKISAFLVISFLLVVFCWLGWSWTTSALCRINCQSQIFVVAKGESRGSIAERLERAGLVRSSVTFQILVVKQGLGRKIQAGDFRLNPGMKPAEIAQELTHGTLDRWVTLIEGLRREEIAEKLAVELGGEQTKFNKEEFLKLTTGLEGQLFPDTYLFPKEADAARVVSMLTLNFEKKTANLKPEKKDLILASIVEREAKYEADRPIVAGILLNRLERDWPLQTDATVQYVVATSRCPLSASPCENWWKKNLMKEDLQVKSPYNTYLNPGLPLGPICSPGLAAIKAALNPTKTDYLYYLSDSEGKMHYAKTLEEHNQNIAKYLR